MPLAVLTVTCLEDSTADLVLDELHNRDIPIVRFDPGADFPSSCTLDVRLGEHGTDGSITTGTRLLDLTQVRSVYWRKPTPYQRPRRLDEHAGRWAAEQSRYGLGGVLATIPGAFYLNPPWRNRDAEYKPEQLITAAACGLVTPRTVITNSLDAVKRFAAEVGTIVYKPLWSTPCRDADGTATVVWTRAVDLVELDDRVAVTAHLFQQIVDKVADIRVTMVGERVFAVRIDGAPTLDWRYNYTALSYELIEAPIPLARAMRAYLAHFGLVFGAFDFALTRDGEWVFLECNPNGQWAWFTDPIPRLIASAIADHLENPRGCS